MTIKNPLHIPMQGTNHFRGTTLIPAYKSRLSLRLTRANVSDYTPQSILNQLLKFHLSGSGEKFNYHLNLRGLSAGGSLSLKENDNLFALRKHLHSLYSLFHFYSF